MAQQRMSRAAIVLLLTTAVVGCDFGDTGIDSYQVPKQPPPIAENDDPAEERDTVDDSKPQRMLAAVVPAGDQVWFFKLTGAVPAIESMEPVFRSLLQSIAAEEDQVSWQLPEGWTEKPGEGFRHATLVAPDSQGEVAVSKLAYQGSSDEDFGQYMLINVNRWRGQMGLPPVQSTSVDELATEVADTKTQVLLVDLTGKAPAGMGMRSPPFANNPPASRPTESPAPAAAASPLFSDELPEGWARKSPRPMTLAIYATANPGAEVAISSYPAIAQMVDKLENINRWRRQIGMPGITGEQVEEATTETTVDGSTGDWVELMPGDEAAPAIVVTMLEREGKMWFFKLSGSAAAVKSQLDAYRTWIETIEFTPPTKDE